MSFFSGPVCTGFNERTASLLLICCITIVWTGCNLAGVVLPDMVVRIMGLLDLCAIPVLVYSTIRIRKSK